MMKDHGIDFGMISRHEIKVMMKLINASFLNSHDDKAIEFAGFCQFIVQISVFIFEKRRIKIPPHLKTLPLYG